MAGSVRTVAVLTLTAVVIACRSQNHEQLEAGNTAVADSAKALAQRVIENSNRMAWDAAFADYSPAEDARYVEGGVMYPSLAALKQSYAELAPNLELVNNTVDSWQIVPLGSAAASITLPIHLRIKAKGRPEFSTQYVWSAVAQQRDGRWQLVQTHESWQNAEQLMAALSPDTTRR